jgi:DNA-binding transcriptional regulator GbsR (MarR family)
MEPALREFIEQMGLKTEAEGLSRTAGRLFAYMVVVRGPCTAEELSDSLSMSRGNVSMTTRLLESKGLLERTTRPGDQRIYYRLPDDPYQNLLVGNLERRRTLREVVATARATLERDGADAPPGTLERLRVFESYYDLVTANLEDLLVRWRDRDGEDGAAQHEEGKVDDDA